MSVSKNQCTCEERSVSQQLIYCEEKIGREIGIRPLKIGILKEKKLYFTCLSRYMNKNTEIVNKLNKTNK